MAQTAADVPLLITSPNSSSERRVNPSWTIAHFKTRLEPITGIPASSQKLVLKLGGSQQQPIEAADEETTTLVAWPLRAYAEIHVTSTTNAPLPNYTDTSLVQKYEMPADEYAARPDTVQAYKRTHQIGRFAPTATDPTQTASRAAAVNAAVADHNIKVGARCRLLPADADGRRGAVAFLGEVPELPGVEGAWWVGVRLDEPAGRNDGTVPGKGGEEPKRYFEADKNCGVFVRPERVECGDFPVVDEFAEGSDMEEL